MEIKNVLISLILGIIVLGLGFGLGIFYQSQQAVTAGQSSVPATPEVVKDLSSGVIPSIAAYGTVTKISGMNVTLSYQGDAVVIPISSTAKVYAFVTPAATKAVPKPTPASQEVSFSTIAIGDNLSINIKVLPNGQLQGLSVIVLPASASTTTTPAATTTK